MSTTKRIVILALDVEDGPYDVDDTIGELEGSLSNWIGEGYAQVDDHFKNNAIPDFTITLVDHETNSPSGASDTAKWLADEIYTRIHGHRPKRGHEDLDGLLGSSYCTDDLLDAVQSARVNMGILWKCPACSWRNVVAEGNHCGGCGVERVLGSELATGYVLFDEGEQGERMVMDVRPGKAGHATTVAFSEDASPGPLDEIIDIDATDWFYVVRIGTEECDHASNINVGDACDECGWVRPMPAPIGA